MPTSENRDFPGLYTQLRKNLKFSLDGRQLVSSPRYGSVLFVWDVKTGKLVKEVKGIVHLAWDFTLDGKAIIALSLGKARAGVPEMPSTKTDSKRQAHGGEGGGNIGRFGRSSKIEVVLRRLDLHTWKEAIRPFAKTGPLTETES